MPPGRYLIAVNEDGGITGDEPFPTAYYPGVFEKDKATIVTMGAGEIREDCNSFPIGNKRCSGGLILFG